MKIDNLIKTKALPSFCTANMDVLKSIMFFCNLKKLPCLIECTSNQVNQDGGYTKKTPKKFIKEILNLRKKIKLNKNQLFIGGDHLGPLPWKNKIKKVAIKNSIKLIESFLNEKFCKIHIDTSIKCKDDVIFNNEIIFERTKKILENLKIRRKIKNRFLIIGSEVPLSGSGDSKKIVLTNIKQVINECKKFRQVLKKSKFEKNRKFGLVVEPGMKYMHRLIKKPDLKKFHNKKIFSTKNNFVFEAHSTDYQPLSILKKLVHNNFKFLKVGPELTYNYSRSLFFMENIENKLFKKKTSFIKTNIFNSMKKNDKYWLGYYNYKNKNLFLESKLDRMRYYFNYFNVDNSIKTLKKNINSISLEKILILLSKKQKREFLYFNKKNLTNFESIKMIFLSKSLIRYYSACGYNIR
tara:strand:- start:1296 stop:2522 length:1227 start_codon:yes stop_codon:yes gene_type:complete